MKFVSTGWCAGKQLILVRTIKELGMFDNYYIDHKTFNVITILLLTKSNSTTEVTTTLYIL